MLGSKVTPVSESQDNDDELDQMEYEEDMYEYYEDQYYYEAGTFSLRREIEKFMDILTYDCLKSSMRWFLESARCDISFTVSH